MSYRMYVKTEKNGKRYQFLGNNVCPSCLIEELKRQGAEFDEDDGIRDFEVKEIQPVIDALEKYILNTYNRKKVDGINIFDFEEDILSHADNNFTYFLNYSKDSWYMLVSSNFVDALGNSIETEYEKGKVIYKIRENKHIYIDAF